MQFTCSGFLYTWANHPCWCVLCSLKAPEWWDRAVCPGTPWRGGNRRRLPESQGQWCLITDSQTVASNTMLDTPVIGILPESTGMSDTYIHDVTPKNTSLWRVVGYLLILFNFFHFPENHPSFPFNLRLSQGAVLYDVGENFNSCS